MESWVRKSIAVCFVFLLLTTPISTVAAYPAPNPAAGDQIPVTESYFDSKNPSWSNGVQTSVNGNKGTKGADGGNNKSGKEGEGKNGNKGEKGGKGKNGDEGEKGEKGKKNKGGAGEQKGQQGKNGQAKPKNETERKGKTQRNSTQSNGLHLGAQSAKWKALFGGDWPGNGTGPFAKNQSTNASRQERSVFNESIDLGPDATALDHRQAAMDLLERAATKSGTRDLSRYIQTLNESSEYVLDADRVDNHTAFLLDKQVVAPLHDRAPNVTQHIVSADKLQAAQAIDDAEHVEQMLQARNVSYDRATVSKELRLAKKAFDRAEQQQNQNTAAAVSKYRTTWIHAQRAIDHMDWATTPNVTIDTRRDIPFEENTTYRVNGTVFDVQSYELQTLTLAHDNDTQTIELPAETKPATILTFNTSIVLKKPVNQITINATDPNHAVAPTDEIPSPATGNDTLWIDSDGLPDEYEASVTGTNPRRWDSDSNHTLADEAGDDISDGAEDFDGDGVSTYNEWVSGLDPFDEDTDGDDLTDQFELRTPGLDPTATDSDGDGTPDGEEDPDEDALSNLREQELGTVPVVPDTDRDGLNESTEVAVYDTDPLQADTDSDGLLDGEEIDLGTDPLDNDTDGDGILDGKETYTTTTTNESVGASVAVTGEGNATSGVSVSNESTETFDDTPVANSTASNVVDLEASRDFESAEISISYNESNATNGTDETNESELAIYRLDSELQEFGELNSTLDSQNGSVRATVDRPATYLVMDSQQWDESFERDLPTRKNANTTRYNDTFDDLDGWECDGNCELGEGEVIIGGESEEVSGQGVGDCPEDWDPEDCLLTGSPPTPTPTPSDPSTPTTGWNTPEPIPPSSFERGITLDEDVVRADVWMLVASETGEDGTASITIEGESSSKQLLWRGNDEDFEWRTLTADLSQFAGEEITLRVETTGDATITLEEIRLMMARDSDGDGLPNAMETGGIRNYKGEVVTTDPFDADTDGDGISDDEEVGVYFPSYRASGYHFLHSDPTSADTDGDGLGDYEETHEDYEIVYTDSPDATRNLIGALHDNDQNPGDYLTPRTSGSSAMQADSDDDGVSDHEEVLLGTDATSRDTDGDGIPDGEEDALSGDPTLFDAQPPRVEVWYANFHKPAWSLKTEYMVSFTASDASGVDRVAVIKKEKTRFEDYPSGYPNSISYGYVQFETGAGETLLDGLVGTTVDVEAEDRHGNLARTTALERSDFYGHLASELDADTIYTRKVAHDLGMLSGLTVGAGENVEMIASILDDPVGFLWGITKIVEVLEKWHLLDDILAAIPGAIDQKQDQQNPYDEASQPGLYGEFRIGWISGYVGYFIAEIAAGAALTKVVKNSKTFAKAVDTLDRGGKLTDAAQYYRAAKGTATAPVRKAGYLLAKGGHEVAKPILRGAKTTGQTYKRWRMYRQVTDGGLCSSSLKDCGVDLDHLSTKDREALGDLMDHYQNGERFETVLKRLDESEREALARFVRESSNDGAHMMARLDTDAAKTLFTLERRSDVSDFENWDEWRRTLVEVSQDSRVSHHEINDYLNNLNTISKRDNIRNYDSLVGEVSRGNAVNFKGSSFEAERTTYYSGKVSEVVVEPVKKIDLKVKSKGGAVEHVELKRTDSVTKNSIQDKLFAPDGGGNVKFADVDPTDGKKTVEIDVRTGEQLNEQELSQLVDQVIEDEINIYGTKIHFDEVRVVTDGGSAKTIWTAA